MHLYIEAVLSLNNRNSTSVCTTTLYQWPLYLVITNDTQKNTHYHIVRRNTQVTANHKIYCSFEQLTTRTESFKSALK